MKQDLIFRLSAYFYMSCTFHMDSTIEVIWVDFLLSLGDFFLQIQMKTQTTAHLFTGMHYTALKFVALRYTALFYVINGTLWRLDVT